MGSDPQPAAGAASELFVGLISGTSLDGIDAALVDFSALGLRLLAARTFAYPAALRQRLLELSQQAPRVSLDELGEIDQRVGVCFADAALAMLDAAGAQRGAVRAIGSHGQTLRHRPAGDAPFTLQIGDPNTLAERCGCPVVADFRRRDVAAGGHGAPLLPALHAGVFAASGETRAVLNLGGIGNLTLLPANGPVRGFDTGPANGLLDAWCLRHTGAAFDRDGAFAAQGQSQPTLLTDLLADPWFALPPPKSTGRDQFHLDWLQARLDRHPGVAAADVQATLIELSARSIANALHAALPACERLIVCGGGVHNPRLLQALTAALPALRIESSAAHGLDPDFVEAAGFAWLARETLAGRPGNLPSVTGARGPRVLGAIYSA